MNVDVEIYMNNLMKFFRENPKELLNLIPKNKEQEFYNRVRQTALNNYEKGQEIILTQKQVIEICVALNHQQIDINGKFMNVIVQTRFAHYSLN